MQRFCPRGAIPFHQLSWWLGLSAVNSCPVGGVISDIEDAENRVDDLENRIEDIMNDIDETKTRLDTLDNNSEC